MYDSIVRVQNPQAKSAQANATAPEDGFRWNPLGVAPLRRVP